MSVRDTNEKISHRLEEIRILHSVKRKLEAIRLQALEKLTLTSNVHAQSDLNRIISYVSNGYNNREGFWLDSINDQPKEWATINFLGINQINTKVAALNEQVELLRGQLPSTEEINGAKARVTQLAMERKDVQTSTLETLESTATVLMSLVDVVITHVLPVYQELVPLEAQAKESKSRELQLQQSISEIMQRYDLARSYKFTIPVKPVLVPSELTELINLCRLIIPQLVNGDTSNLAKYEALTSSVKDLQVA